MSEIFDREQRKSYQERRLRAKEEPTQSDSKARSSSPGSEQTMPNPPKKKARKRLQPERKIRAQESQTDDQARLTVSLPKAMIRNLKLIGIVSGKTISKLVEEMLHPALEEIELTQTE